MTNTYQTIWWNSESRQSLAFNAHGSQVCMFKDPSTNHCGERNTLMHEENQCCFATTKILDVCSNSINRSFWITFFDNRFFNLVSNLVNWYVKPQSIGYLVNLAESPTFYAVNKQIMSFLNLLTQLKSYNYHLSGLG